MPKNNSKFHHWHHERHEILGLFVLLMTFLPETKWKYVKVSADLM